MRYIYIANLGRNLNLGLEFGALKFGAVRYNILQRTELITAFSKGYLLILCQIFLQPWAGKARLWVRNSERKDCMTIYLFVSVYVLHDWDKDSCYY